MPSSRRRPEVFTYQRTTGFFIHQISEKDFQNYFIRLIADNFPFLVRVSEKEKYFFQKKLKLSVTFFQGSSLKDK
ncbi:MAG TPA: hypothetical protein DIT10_01650 [Chryseobacterium sp.]|nr:hypothetical protein [Chryseobacterium sp.]